MKRLLIVQVVLICLTVQVFAQNKPVKFSLDSTGANYVKFGFLGQIWLRYNSSNPGTLVNGTPKSETFDIGLRRWRLTTYAQISDRVSMFVQFGQNNFNYLSAKYTGAFFHDGFFDYKVADQLQLGAGLSGWSGPSRYASPSIGNLLAIDAPLYQQATNGISDQFLRKIGAFAKGYLGKVEYRLILATPMSISSNIETTPNSTYAVYNNTSSALQPQAYIKYQFFEKESIQSPYPKSTYLGTKKVLALGAGFVQQNKANWMLNGSGDTVTNQMLQLSADVFYETPLPGDKAFTLYAAYHNYDFGKNYLRVGGPMNPANGSNDPNVLSGSGNGYPFLGTGHSYFLQTAYLYPVKKVFLQPYVCVHIANYEGLNDIMTNYNFGFNYYVTKSQNVRFTLDYAIRPIFEGTIGNADQSSTRGTGMMMLQVSY